MVSAGGSIGERSEPGNSTGSGAEPHGRHGCRPRAEPPRSLARDGTVLRPGTCKRRRSEKTGTDAGAGARITALPLRSVTRGLSSATEDAVIGVPAETATSTLQRDKTSGGGWRERRRRRRPGTPGPSDESPPLLHTATTAHNGGVAQGGNRGGRQPPRGQPSTPRFQAQGARTNASPPRGPNGGLVGLGVTLRRA